MYTKYQIVSYILGRMGYKRLSSYVLTCDNMEINLYINFIKRKLKKINELQQFIDYFL